MKQTQHCLTSEASKKRQSASALHWNVRIYSRELLGKASLPEKYALKKPRPYKQVTHNDWSIAPTEVPADSQQQLPDMRINLYMCRINLHMIRLQSLMPLSWGTRHYGTETTILIAPCPSSKSEESMNIIKWLFQAAKSGGNLLQSNSNWNSEEPDKHVPCLMEFIF